MLRVAHLQNEVGTKKNIGYEASYEINSEMFQSLFVESEEIPQNSRQMSHKICNQCPTIVYV